MDWEKIYRELEEDQRAIDVLFWAKGIEGRKKRVWRQLWSSGSGVIASVVLMEIMRRGEAWSGGKR